MLVERLHGSQDKRVLTGCYHALHTLAKRSNLPSAVRMPSAAGLGLPPIHATDVFPLAIDHLKVGVLSY